MRQAAAEAGELFDALGGFGNSADRRLVERGFDLFGVAGQFADRPGDAPTPQTIKAATAVSGEIALHRGPADACDLASLQADEPGMHRPKHEHLSSHVQVRMQVPLGCDDCLFSVRQIDRCACHP